MESEFQLYDKEIAKKFTDGGLEGIGAGDANLGSLLVRLDGLAKSRMVFWELIQGAYGNYIREVGDKRWPSLHTLVGITPPPPGMPLPEEEHVVEYPRKFGSHMMETSTFLFRFCTKVYPAFVPDRTLGQCSLISDSKFEVYHFARMDLAKTWNRIGKLLLVNTIELSQIISVVPTAGPMVNMLCYLEIALAQWCRDKGAGKVGLYHLNKQWKESVKPV